MKIAITKIVYSSWYLPEDVIEAVKVGNYTKRFIWNDGQMDRVEYYSEEKGLFKVSYYYFPQGQSDAVDKHFRVHGGVLCEVVVPLSADLPFARAERVDLYDEAGNHEKSTDVYFDGDGRAVKRVERDSSGKVLQVRHDTYDDSGNLLQFSTYDGDGKQIGQYQADDWQ